MKSATTFLLVLVLALFLPACGGGSGGGGGSSTVAGNTGGGDDGGGDPVDPGEMDAAELAFALAVLDLTNAERSAVGAGPLTWHDGAAQVAYEHCVDMEVRDFWNNGYPHVNPDGQDPGDRLAEAGIGTAGWGENIATGFNTPESVVAGWMGSDSHRQNLLHPTWTHLGIGVHDGPNPMPFWTQMFLNLP